ncbi:SDR family oxidoreductase [Asanoa iriomotensis]|uniref:LysR family transcriptional regulator n=1 Tax=Asanoa iriomotensis TaxID=234613 RepID=A0ABQ4CD91_9ACTN|nr:SDR family oxidoreductase [Asanoa iriomotensis]GIF60431.1 LysR family transcriptional regulator [Asanoa iriomotensis]
MKIVVFGGTGLIGSQVVRLLGQAGHEVVAQSPSTGVNTVTGEGVAGAVAGADVVVDVTNSPSFAPDDVLAFFRASTGNLLAAEKAAGVGHHVALSVVGADRSPDSTYLPAKVAQEKLIAAGGVPYTIVRATQFFEFLGAIADSATDGGAVHIAPVAFQPMASADVARAVADAAVAPPVNGAVETAGPDRLGFDQAIRQALAAKGDHRTVVADPAATYFGQVQTDETVVPIGDYRPGAVHLTDWLAAQAR